ncbi:phosphoglycerate mutase [Purpureocillium lavendulum]|uniref:Phosphoglycerate mutase n=1 Tax=Purpureocillium lavendulum TaxID=1247861 RepID=A0AB34G0J6_9HYPO|nr:phosphoglycerate mutase [Purpureocillium lavendulum]
MPNSPPAYLFVVRHGNRLDAADKKWHLTSPTPYDPPLTYGGFLQARQVGNQISNYLEQAKLDDEVSQNGAALSAKRRRFKVVIHSSPFLRCVQTSIGISSGLAQTSPDSIFGPADIIVPKAAPTSQPFQFKSSLLRLDSFLGEWLSPEYFEMITPPPGPALMMGGAKADLLRREDYSAYTEQWDSMREPLDFGDGGKFGEEWTSMHTRFRGGLRKLVNWYATTDTPADLVAQPAKASGGEGPEVEKGDEDVDTVVIVVSHGAGCNALIGAITHQPVLMDVAIASITMATRKPNLDYKEMLAAAEQPADASAKPLVQVDKMYDIRLSASTEHLKSSGSTPVSSRSTSTSNIWTAPTPGTRGRTSTLGSTGGPVMSPFTYADPFSSTGSRSTSASAAMGSSLRRDSGSFRPTPRVPVIATTEIGSAASQTPPQSRSPGPGPSFGLWAPVPSSLRLMDDGGDDDVDDFGSMMPNFDQKRFESAVAEDEADSSSVKIASTGPVVSSDSAVPQAPSPTAKNLSRGPMLAAPIKLNTSVGPEKPAEEMKMSQLGGGLGGLWGQPPPRARRSGSGI